MISSHESIEVSPALQKMLGALDLLHQLQKQTQRPSNGKAIINTLRLLQEAYHALDGGIVSVINTHLLNRNPGLLDALQKKGSKICKPLELASKLHDGLSQEIRTIIAAHPDLLAATKSLESSAQSPKDEAVTPPSGTMVINSDNETDKTLADAIKYAGRQMDSNLYLMFSHDETDDDLPGDPFLTVVQTFEILLKTKRNKEEISRNGAKPLNYDNAYRTTLLKQFTILNAYKPILHQCLNNPDTHECVSSILELLEGETTKTVPDMLIKAGKISALLNDDFLKNLKLFQLASASRLTQ